MKIIERIKKLLNQTVENGCTEEEAKTSFALARKLMIKHKIEDKDIKEPNEDDIVKEELIYDCNVHWIYCLLKVFLNNFGAMNFMINRDKELHCVLFGTKIDIDCVKTLMNCAYDYVNQASQKYLNDYVEIFGVKDESVKNSFRTGFIRGLEDKYQEQNKHLSNEEALMVIPNKEVQNKFEEFTKGFKEQELDYSEQTDKNNVDFLAMQAGYNEGRVFGSTALKGE